MVVCYHIRMSNAIASFTYSSTISFLRLADADVVYVSTLFISASANLSCRSEIPIRAVCRFLRTRRNSEILLHLIGIQ